MSLKSNEIKEKVFPVLEKYGVENAYLFGSYARGDATEKSDVDLRIDKGKVFGFQLGGLFADLEETLALPVDLVTTEQLSKEFLKKIEKEEIMLYGKSR